MAAASTSSTTLVTTAPEPAAVQQEQDHVGPSQQPSTVIDTVTLQLVPRRARKGKGKAKGKAVRWAEDVEEKNEFSGLKKSKKCCIFQKQRAWGEWSDGEDSGDECNCREPALVQQQPSQASPPPPAPPPAQP